MLSHSTSPSFPVQFNSMNKEAISVLNEYLCNNIIKIACPVRFRIINKFDYNVQSFIDSYHKNFIDNPDMAYSFSHCDFKLISEIYKSITSFIGALECSTKSKANFDKRCRLLSGAGLVEKIEDYMEYSPLNFHLIGCLYDIIFNRLDISGWKRLILKNHLDYSNKYEKIPLPEIMKTAKVTRPCIYLAIKNIERKVNNVIKDFKILEPYCSYKSKYLYNADVIKIGWNEVNCIAKDEGVEGITPFLAATILSVLYNYKLRAIGVKGKEEYLLIKGEESEADKAVRIIRG
jgi:hypothetical protein